MKIMVSACLAGENCKYNGGNNRNEKADLIVLQSFPCAVREELADAVRARHSQKSQLRSKAAVC